MYTISLPGQWELSAYGIGFGFLLCAFYIFWDNFRACFFQHTGAVILFDVLYFIMAAFAVFSFLLVFDDGILRIYSLFYIATGFLISRVSCFRFLNRKIERIAGGFYRFMHRLRSFFYQNIVHLAVKIKKNVQHRKNKTQK